ncbi:hypothetical protein Fmac_003250 [Flemingia macrophylla]|uniref:Cullin family profile domain-containing protein n=1 Tax=Flemingia macrophylla TaxID=520843 RepID=A0ABD1NQ73_9FABA
MPEVMAWSIREYGKQLDTDTELLKDLVEFVQRLLDKKDKFYDAERSFIVKLKTECGSKFTSKLEGIFTNMKTSLDTMQGFYASHPELRDGPRLTVQVMETSLWPTQSTITCNLPAETPVLCEKFHSYYLMHKAGDCLGKLIWTQQT